MHGKMIIKNPTKKAGIFKTLVQSSLCNRFRHGYFSFHYMVSAKQQS